MQKNKNITDICSVDCSSNASEKELREMAKLIKDLEPEEKDDLIKALTLAKIIFRKRGGGNKDNNGPGDGGDGSRTGEKIA